ncbi:MAG TPA: hypothetical protein VNU84_05755 [Candidatus Acidoferrum sp.]|jgi:hypothetical protein|nr:hypothetical protein [Candidatus Acidoferrum sp.]
MKLFGKKRAQDGVRSRQNRTANGGEQDKATHRVTLDLSRAKELAAMLASSRASRFVEITDLLAGLYLYEWDRLSAYWPEENREDVEEMMRDICRISPQRWNYWIQLYDTRRKESEPKPRWKRLGKRIDGNAESPAPIPSARLENVFRIAEKVSPFRDPRPRPEKGGPNANALPVLTSECVLLCIAKFMSTDAGKKLHQSGLNIELLERAVIDPKRSPLR